MKKRVKENNTIEKRGILEKRARKRKNERERQRKRKEKIYR